jgi:hypothetical protein
MMTKEDVAAAKDFFFSRQTVFVHERSVWFGMAGLLEPPLPEMRPLVKRLLKYGCNNRRGEGK